MKPSHVLRRYLLTGLAIWLPVLVTFYLLRFFFILADSVLGHYANLLVKRWYGHAIPGIGLLLAFLLLLFSGYMAEQFFGRWFVAVLERWFGNLPLVRYIYPPAKQMAELLFTSKSRAAFHRVVLVPYPSSGVYSLGFVTNEALPALDAKVGQHLVSVLVPHTPTPLTGYMLVVPAANVVSLDITIEEGIALIVSGGIVGTGKLLQGQVLDQPIGR